MKKHFIQADQLLRDSYNLAWKIFESGLKPDYIIGVRGGGAQEGIAVQEREEIKVRQNQALKKACFGARTWPKNTQVCERRRREQRKF